MNTITFKVGGMHCDRCAERIEKLLGKEPGVRNANVSFAEESAVIRYSAHGASGERLREVIEAGGFNVLERSA